MIYHTGITPPPEIPNNPFKLFHTPTIAIEFKHHHIPNDISEFLQSQPLAVIMSKNAVNGLKNWLEKYNLSIDFFQKIKFWTVGERTHQHLLDELGLESWHPTIMTGEGIIQSLRGSNLFPILLISAHEPIQAFIESLQTEKIQFFHFPLYKTRIVENSEFTTHFIDNENNIVVCTSPSTVEGILNCLSKSNLLDMKVKLVSIGPTTSNAILEKNGKVFYEAKNQSISSLYTELIHLNFNYEQS